ncbi:hypothetical protein [Methylosinus sp. LW3]|uniref:hypothetical protein n=1 Tax=Methylosinus sp. LW3 TaxID=107635 RepID=UPI0004B4AA8E|nr:hypothetical protein [Methylosinus sp. LW3]
MKKIEIDRTAFYMGATALNFVSWVLLSVYADVSLLVLFLPVFVFFYVLVRLCVRYVFEMK